MVELRFPADRAVGVLDWPGSWRDDTGPVLATGVVAVPDGVAVELEVRPVHGTERIDARTWRLVTGNEPVDLAFVRELPPDVLGSVTLRSVREGSVAALVHLAPGLRRLHLAWSGLADAVLPAVAALSGLTMLQSYGNRFTDAGVQQLAALTRLDHLYLEEETLHAAAFAFVDRLPYLLQLGLQDTDLTEEEVDELRRRLPGVDVTR